MMSRMVEASVMKATRRISPPYLKAQEREHFVDAGEQQRQPMRRSPTITGSPDRRGQEMIPAA